MVGNTTLLWSESTGPIRAWELSPPVSSFVRRIETLWLPDLRLSPDITVDTFRGPVAASEVLVDDWLKVSKETMNWVQPEMPYYLHGSTQKVWEWIQGLSKSQAYSRIDMMDSPDHVSHWKKDQWILCLKGEDRWVRESVRGDHDNWWLRVLSTQDSHVDLVPIRGSWSAYGVSIKT